MNENEHTLYGTCVICEEDVFTDGEGDDAPHDIVRIREGYRAFMRNGRIVNPEALVRTGEVAHKLCLSEEAQVAYRGIRERADEEAS